MGTQAEPEVALPAFPETVRAGRDAGLLGHLTIWQNLRLPLEYHARDTAHVAEEVVLLFELCGEERERLPRLLASYPDDLSGYQRRLAGFVRAMLLEPEVLVLEDMLDGLTDREKEKASQWKTAFHLRFPFRTLLCRNSEERGVPEGANA